VTSPRRPSLLVWIGWFPSAVAFSAQTARVMPPSTSRGEWPTYSGDLACTKYSPLDQIDRTNFGNLRVVWRAKSPDAFLSVTMPGGGEWYSDARAVFDELNQADPNRWRDGQPSYVVNFKATPLMVGGLLFVNSSASVGAAFDAKTGAVRWVYNPKSYEAGTTSMSLMESTGRGLLDRRQRRAHLLGHR
jgi:glucose dehydrogenase